MFYNTSSFREPLAAVRTDRAHAIVVLLPSESKRLIAKAVVELPEVKSALAEGIVIVSRGVTPSFIAEELGASGLVRPYCSAGIVTDGRLATTLAERRMGPWVFRRGELVEEEAEAALAEFDSTDVSIKGANAVDPDGNVGVLAASEAGGTIGSIWPTLSARGAYLIAPTGLEKLVPSVIDAAMHCGNRLFDYVMGSNVGLIPVVNALVVTEVQALELLTGVTATHVSSGGVGGSEGAVILTLEGGDETVRTAFELVESLKDEPATAMPELEPAVRIP